MAQYLVQVNNVEDEGNPRWVKVALEPNMSLNTVKRILEHSIKSTLIKDSKNLEMTCEMRALGHSQKSNLLDLCNKENHQDIQLQNIPIIRNQLFCSVYFNSESKSNNSCPKESKKSPDQNSNLEFKKNQIKKEKISYTPLTSYTFYESGKEFVMVILKIENIEKCPKTNIEVDLQKRSIDVKILKDDENIMKNWRFRVAKTHDKYVPEKSKFWIKKIS